MHYETYLQQYSVKQYLNKKLTHTAKCKALGKLRVRMGRGVVSNGGGGGVDIARIIKHMFLLFLFDNK